MGLLRPTDSGQVRLHTGGALGQRRAAGSPPALNHNTQTAVNRFQHPQTLTQGSIRSNALWDGPSSYQSGGSWSSWGRRASPGTSCSAR